MNEYMFSKEIGGRTLSIDTQKFARQASGAVTVQYGDTVVLATTVMSKEPNEEIDFLPLFVDYEEKLYAAGKIKGSRFIKREGRPSDDSVLRGRLIDRAIRPLFPQHLKHEVQVIINVLSYDNENDPAILGLVAASTALNISNIPFAGPVAAARIGHVNGEYVLNPTTSALEKSDLNLVLAVYGDDIIMLEADCNEVPEEDIEGAIDFGKKQLQEIVSLITEVQQQHGKEKLTIPQKEENEELKKEIEQRVKKEVETILYTETPAKQKRKLAIKEIGKKLQEDLKEQYPDKEDLIMSTYITYVEQLVSDNIVKDEKRVANRALDEIRPLEIQTGILPRPHGTGYFMRGETQALTITTLGSPGDEQIIDGIEEEYKKRFIHHYNFPPFSVGEVKPLRGPSRRDIGHGALAEKALASVIPSKEDFPYTIRLVSEIFGSNGSSSMAATCGSTLALMDAGVPIKAPVAGIAMGMASTKEGKYKILTDIQDLEDVEGGMDFKIAGTNKGITVIQMDTKTLGITKEMIHDTLTQGHQARIELLEAMTAVIPEPKKELSPYAPRIHTLTIDPEKIRDVIGPAGKTINEIIDKTGVEIDIEQSGLVLITAEEGANIKEAIEMVENITKDAQPGEEYKGKVVRLMDFGAFVELWPGKEGLVHVSKISEKHVESVFDVLKEGQAVNVKVQEIDEMGRINLTMKGITQETPLKIPEGKSRPPRFQKPHRRERERR